LRFGQLRPQPAVLRFQIHGLSWCGFAGILVLAHPDSQGFFAQTELVRDAGDRPVRGVRIGLGVDDELDGTSLEFVGVFHWQERNSFFQSPCLYYPRGDSVCRVASSSQGQQSSSDWPRNNAHDRHADDALISHEEPAPKEQGTCWRRPRQSSTAGKTPGTGRTPMPWPICSPRMPSSSMSSDSGGTIGRTSARLTPSASPASTPARALR